jgi:hypothetical protein
MKSEHYPPAAAIHGSWHDADGRRPRVPGPHWQIWPISWQAASLTGFAGFVGIDHCLIEATQ